MRLSHSEKAVQALQAIPSPRRRTKILSTLAGIIVFGGAWFLPKYLGFSWQVALGVAAFGGFIASKDLVVTFLRLVPALIYDIVLALRGQRGPPQ